MDAFIANENIEDYYMIRPGYIQRGDLVKLESGGEEIEGEVDSSTYFPQSGEYMIALKDEGIYNYFEDSARIAQNKVEEIYIAEKSLEDERWRLVFRKAETIAKALDGELDNIEMKEYNFR